jgi:hypothetical protein
MQAGYGRQKGDPRRAAQAVWDALAAPDTPVRLVLGGGALKLAQTAVAAFARDLDDWAEVSRGADFPRTPAG